MPTTMPGDMWEFEAGLRQMAEGWSLYQALLFLILVALGVAIVSAGGAALLSLRGPQPSH